jgi:hypothetical protein
VTIALAIDAVAIAALLFNLVFIVQSWRRLRRQAQLETLLGQLCIDAFLHRHLPIWQPWCAAFGYTFRVNVQPREGTND